MITNVRAGPRPVDEADLQAYVDGLLDAKRRSEVEGYLAINPEEVERVEAYRLQNIGLHALFDGRSVGDEPPASASIERLRHDLHTAVLRQRLVRRAAASLVLVLGIGAVGWWSLHGIPWEREPRIARQTTTTIEPEDLRPRDPPRPVDVAPEVAQAGLVGWLSQRVAGGRPEWPDLRSFGLSLRGERMTATANGLAVVLTYEEKRDTAAAAAGRRLAVHIDLNSDELPIVTPPPVRGREVALYWRSGPLVLGVVGAMERQELLRIAEAVSAQVAVVGPEPDAPGDDRLHSVEAEPLAPTRPRPIARAADDEAPEDEAPTGVARQADAGVIAPAALEPITQAAGDGTRADDDGADVAHDASGADAIPEQPAADDASANGSPAAQERVPGAGGEPGGEDGDGAEPDEREPISDLPRSRSQHAPRDDVVATEAGSLA